MSLSNLTNEERKNLNEWYSSSTIQNKIEEVKNEILDDSNKKHKLYNNIHISVLYNLLAYKHMSETDLSVNIEPN